MTLNFRLRNKPSKIDGTGTFALENIPARKKIGDLQGEVISVREARKRAAVIEKIAIVEFGDGRALDAGSDSNQLRYINHSCNPNTYMRVCYGKVEFYAKKPIANGEELTCNYGSTHHDGKLRCHCGSDVCKGYL